MDKDDDEENNLPIWNLSTTNGKENDETEDPIDPDKPSFSAVEQIETYLPSPIAALPIFEITAKIFQVLNIMLCYHHLMYLEKHHQ